MARRVVVWILLGGILVGGYLYARNTYYSLCDRPILYKIGNIDKRFGVSEADLRKDIDLATGIWSKAQGQELFHFDEKAVLVVGLVFDERQALNNEIQKQEGTLKGDQSTLSSQIAEYKKEVADFDKKVADLNSEISYWNGKGGAPAGEYDKLLAEQKSLQAEADRLNALAVSLNQKTQTYNAKVVKINGTINTFNSDLTAKPEEGVYDSGRNTIDIFFMINKQELVHTLSHEFGHALGLNHVLDPRAIMYAQASDTVKAVPSDLEELKTICKKRSFLQIFLEKINSFSNLHLRLY